MSVRPDAASHAQETIPSGISGAVRPALIAFALSLFLLATIIFSQVYANETPYAVNRRLWANDFRFFYNAGKLYSRGENPYQERYFTSPPTTAAMFVPISKLPLPTAYTLFFIFTAAGCLGGLWLLTDRFFKNARTERNIIFLLTSAILLFGFPFQFLLDRGNTDGGAFILSALGLLALPRREWLAGILIGVAACLKVYPLLLLGPIFVLGYRRTTIWGALLILGFSLATLHWWPNWFARFGERDGGFRVDENASLANAAFYVLDALAPDTVFSEKTGKILSATPVLVGKILFLVLLGGMLLADFRRTKSDRREERLAHIILYFPLMVSFPNLVFTYELIFAALALPAICYLEETATNPNARTGLFVLAAGLALSQFHIIIAQKLWESLTVHALPSLGVVLMCAGALIVKWSPSSAAAAPNPHTAAAS